MSDNIQITPMECEEPLARLERFCQGLDHALGRAGLSAEEVMRVFYAATMAECPRCGIKVFGEELYAVSQRPSPERASAKIGRLRLGYCARQGCESDHYRLEFLEHPSVNWHQVLAQANGLQAKVDRPKQSGASIRLVAALLRPRLRARVCVVLATALVLLFARHWYRGGSIPLIRAPEDFRVDPLPEETHAPLDKGSPQ